MEQQFGEKEVCFRTLDLYTSAVLESTLNPVVQPKAEFRSVLNEMSKVHLRTLVLGTCMEHLLLALISNRPLLLSTSCLPWGLVCISVPLCNYMPRSACNVVQAL